MSPQELNVIRGLTKAIENATREMRRHNDAQRGPLTNTNQSLPTEKGILLQGEDFEGETVLTLPVYAPTFDETPIDERTSNGGAKVTPQGIEISIPEHLYPEMAAFIIKEGEPTGFEVKFLHRRPVGDPWEESR